MSLFEYYRIFYYVAKYRNFTKAARVPGNSLAEYSRSDELSGAAGTCDVVYSENRGCSADIGWERNLIIMYLLHMAQIFCSGSGLSENDGLLHGNIVIGTSETALNIFLVVN